MSVFKKGDEEFSYRFPIANICLATAHSYDKFLYPHSNFSVLVPAADDGREQESC
jgi:hypothetical protein